MWKDWKHNTDTTIMLVIVGGQNKSCKLIVCHALAQIQPIRYDINDDQLSNDVNGALRIACETQLAS